MSNDTEVCRWVMLPTIKEPYQGVNYIHPLKQKVVEELIEYTTTNYPQVNAIIVFGSSVTSRCYPGSDVDIVICGDEDHKFIPPDNDVYDVIFVQSLTAGSELVKEIAREGVVVYGEVLSDEGG